MEDRSFQQIQQELAQCKARVNELSLLNEELTDFIENAAIPLHWVNGKGIITWANQAELTALGYEKQEYIGQPIAKFHADQSTIEDILTRLINNETLHNYSARLKCKDGSIKHVLISSNVLRKEEKFIHTRCFTRDITAMVLEEQRKNDFVAMVSHELKTPLTSILGYLQVMLSKTKNSGDPFISMALAKTENQAKSMIRMIEDFLNLSRLEVAKIELNLETFQLHILLQEVIQEIQLISHSHNINLIHNGPITIVADRAKIYQVMVNLINNAIKYSPPQSSITIGYQLHGTAVKIYVTDHGIGIGEADQKQLFERFYRVQSQQTKHTVGFGIGLYLVAEILRYHKSKIEVKSSPEMGSTFHFLLPINEEQSPAQQSQ
ncbi:PAS domain-containing sensor histidine kinase [Pedobacter polaris]|uniref:PAS domain-containing sensor histidine kinase n=1 Tax=Pedobacter polaris TaxID=2571273 RepID=UPI00145F8969|nr:ATP-binding protein [Pedobacter polaris]